MIATALGVQQREAAWASLTRASEYIARERIKQARALTPAAGQQSMQCALALPRSLEIHACTARLTGFCRSHPHAPAYLVAPAAPSTLCCQGMSSETCAVHTNLVRHYLLKGCSGTRDVMSEHRQDSGSENEVGTGKPPSAT
jgi:hypothetical protein